MLKIMTKDDKDIKDHKNNIYDEAVNININEYIFVGHMMND